MSLANKANQLENVVEKIVSSLNEQKADARDNVYAVRCYKNLEPLSIAYSKAINVEKDRDKAMQIVSEMKGLIKYIGTLAAKGDFDLVDTKYLDEFDDLSTIFQETMYRNEGL